jgi:hypothetical protein
MDDAFSSTMGDLPSGMLEPANVSPYFCKVGLHGEDIHRVQIASYSSFGDAPLGVFVRAYAAG